MINYKVDEDFIELSDFDKNVLNYKINVPSDYRKIEIEGLDSN